MLFKTDTSDSKWETEAMSTYPGHSTCRRLAPLAHQTLVISSYEKVNCPIARGSCRIQPTFPSVCGRKPIKEHLCRLHVIEKDIQFKTK